MGGSAMTCRQQRTDRSLVASAQLAQPGKAVFAILLGLLVAACGDSPTEPGRGAFSFETLAKNTLAGASGPVHLREVVRDSARFSALWSEVWSGQGPAVPAVDFRRDMVVAATASGSCFDDVTIESISLRDSGLEIRISKPLPTLCLCVALAHSTFHLVKVQRVDAPDSYVERTVAPLCPS
jgi:hypothetical protein